jgi:opacity protein-like surface antigen
LPVTPGGALGVSPRYELTYTKEALDEELKVVEGKVECSDVPFDDTFVPPPEPPSRALGGGFFERSSVQAYAGLELGGGGAKALYDDLVIEPRSFVAGAFAGVRVQQPGNWFIGIQAGFFGTNLTRDAAPGFNVGLRYGMPVDVQVGTTMILADTPVTLYGSAGPMAAITRTSAAGVTDHFTLAGATFTVGADVHVTSKWSIGANVRYYNVGPTDAKSEGQHVDGINATLNVKNKF